MPRSSPTPQTPTTRYILRCKDGDFETILQCRKDSDVLEDSFVVVTTNLQVKKNILLHLEQKDDTWCEMTSSMDGFPSSLKPCRLAKVVSNKCPHRPNHPHLCAPGLYEVISSSIIESGSSEETHDSMEFVGSESAAPETDTASAPVTGTKRMLNPDASSCASGVFPAKKQPKNSLRESDVVESEDGGEEEGEESDDDECFYPSMASRFTRQEKSRWCTGWDKVKEVMKANKSSQTQHAGGKLYPREAQIISTMCEEGFTRPSGILEALKKKGYERKLDHVTGAVKDWKKLGEESTFKNRILNRGRPHLAEEGDDLLGEQVRACERSCFLG